jgi:RHS repeat-associated protein
LFTCNALNALRLRLEELRKADPETFHLAAHRLLPCRITASTGALPTSCADTTAHGNIVDIAYDFGLGNGDNGNVLNITNYKDASRNQSFGYDSVNRLTSAQNAGSDCSLLTVNGKTKYWGNSYTYDEWGNLNQKTVTKCGAEYLNVAPLTNNQLTGYGYDAAGNMTSDPTDSVTSTYDQENRISVATKNGVATTYVYDADGDRVQKSNSATGTLYWYMAPGIIAESDLSGNLTSEYIFFGGERVARKDFPGNTVSYYFSDHLKTASVITDAAGNIKAESDYYPWGGELQFVNNDSNHYKFTAKKRDTESGLDYFGARYYSNGLGRFITPDWAAKATAVPYAELSDSGERDDDCEEFDSATGHECSRASTDKRVTRFSSTKSDGKVMGPQSGSRRSRTRWCRRGVRVS